MNSLFFSENWVVIEFYETEKFYKITCEYKPEVDYCLKCGVVGKLYKHGTKPINVVDLPLRMKPTAIKLMQKRYQCRACRKTFMQPNSDIDPNRRITKRCVDYIKKQALRQTLTRIADSIGVDEKTVRLIVGEGLFNDAINGDELRVNYYNGLSTINYCTNVTGENK